MITRLVDDDDDDDDDSFCTCTNANRYEEAVDDCDKAIKGDPTLLKAYTRCGRAYLHMGVLDRAYECFDEVKERAHGIIRQKFGVSPTLSTSSSRSHSGKWPSVFF